METYTEILKATATILWPMIVIAVLLAFRPAIAAIIDSAKSRKFTIRMGGQELTMEEASSQQLELIADIQSQLLELKKKVEGGEHNESNLESFRELMPASANAILWIDDNPKKNSYLVERITKSGVSVDLASSSEEALAKVDGKKYSSIISNLGRKENGTFNAVAGIDFLKKIREQNPSIPIVITTHGDEDRRFGKEAKQAGATTVTNSQTELFGFLKLAKGSQ